MDQQLSVEKGKTSSWETKWMTVGGMRHLLRWAQVHGGLSERCRTRKGSSRVLWGELSVGRSNKTRELLRLFCTRDFGENSERKYRIQGHETSIMLQIRTLGAFHFFGERHRRISALFRGSEIHCNFISAPRQFFYLSRYSCESDVILSVLAIIQIITLLININWLMRIFIAAKMKSIWNYQKDEYFYQQFIKQWALQIQSVSVTDRLCPRNLLT